MGQLVPCIRAEPSWDLGSATCRGGFADLLQEMLQHGQRRTIRERLETLNITTSLLLVCRIPRFGVLSERKKRDFKEEGKKVGWSPDPRHYAKPTSGGLPPPSVGGVSPPSLIRLCNLSRNAGRFLSTVVLTLCQRQKCGPFDNVERAESIPSRRLYHRLKPRE